MKNIQSALVLLPNQLFKPELLPSVDIIFVVEEPLFFGTDGEFPLSLHKQKLVLHRASMRRYVEETLWPLDLKVEFVELHDLQNTAEILVRAQQAGAELVMMFDPTDHTIETRLKRALETVIQTPFELRILPNPNFMLRRGEVEEYFGEKSTHKFADFYQWQRERFNVLIDENYKPIGGKWSFDTAKPGRLPVDQKTPGFASFGNNKFVEEAKIWVNKNFANNPGSLENFFWPTSHAEANEWLDEFIKNRLDNFGVYEETLDGNAALLYHSGISAPLNIGLLNPDEVVEKLISSSKKRQIPIESLEGFIRQVIGWREYIRGLYVNSSIPMRNSNGLQQERSLGIQWWNASTGLPPVDAVINKVITSAYAQSSERQTVIGNIMLLSEIQPSEMYKWFASLFIDSYDWVMVPNVYGMTQFNYLGGMVSEPYISDSEDILKISNFEKDIWCDVWDGLFWGFVEKHSTMLSKNPKTSGMVKSLHKLDPDRKRIIGYRAQDFLANL
jgi:deoxyribodipyrimidine photolyase-related protein